ncbi:hypothetical protein OCK74_00435 [Chitinophagaceae bacterium LB-8]|uniref:Uncharacterized protein n=1 Tax=Paraflavisolibacter caeni TaxID=2982496 RepID=A0A9X3BES4_9BACT|nr:hypothetical protein [Paraflavisolibacter caeni]MCU7547554.1 hypothetical protein [Paraflavisolibacter caeni]
MAKIVPSLISLQGTLYDVTHVNSKSYPAHTRAVRGTYKRAICNSVLEQNSMLTSLLNKAAKPVHDALKQLAGPFKQRDLWQQLLSRMRSASSPTLSGLYRTLESLEINKAYPLGRRVPVPQVVVRSDKEGLILNMTAIGHPVFGKKVKAEQYCYELFVLWMNKDGQLCGIEHTGTEWIQLSAPVPICEFWIDHPTDGQYYILCLKLQAGQAEKEVESFAGMGMRIVGTGLWG